MVDRFLYNGLNGCKFLERDAIGRHDIDRIAQRSQQYVAIAKKTEQHRSQIRHIIARTIVDFQRQDGPALTQAADVRFALQPI